MRTFAIKTTVLLVASGLLACGFDPHPGDGVVPCSAGCPSGYYCGKSNTCWAASTLPYQDAGTGTGGRAGAGGARGNTDAGYVPEIGAGGIIGTGGVRGTTDAGYVSEIGAGGMIGIGGYRTDAGPIDLQPANTGGSGGRGTDAGFAAGGATAIDGGSARGGSTGSGGGVAGGSTGGVDATVTASDTPRGCTSPAHDDGTGNCVASGCAAEYHNGGQGACVAIDICTWGYHNDGSGNCIINDACPTNQLPNAAGACVPTAGSKWTQTSAPQVNWSAVASSADGTKLVATAIGESTYSSTGGYIYTSTDSGATWTQQAHGTSREVWRAVASSADGTKLVAVVDGGYIYTSTDSGATWSQRATSQRWRAVASSADGTNLVATVGTTSSSATLGYVYTSADSGVTWTQRLAAGAHYWQAVSSSADGSKIVATSTYGYVYTSTDSGANWTERKPSSISSDYWGAVVSSSDGMRIVAAHHINGSTSNDNFQTSIDEGSTWTTATPYQLYDDISCRALATSASAMKLVAATSTYYCLNSSNCNYSFYVSTSSDGGTSWDSLLSSPQIDDIASSADGTHLVAIGPAGIFTSSGPTP